MRTHTHQNRTRRSPTATAAGQLSSRPSRGAAPPHAPPAATSAPVGPATHADRLQALLAQHGRTFAGDAGIRLQGSPGPLLQLLVLATLLAAPVRHEVALRASRALAPLTRSTASLARAETDDVDRLLTGAGYWRFHRAKAALLVRAAQTMRETCRGDLRALYDAATSPEDLHRALCTIPGVGAQAAHIVLREAQGVWPDLQPYLDERVLEGAGRCGLPTDAARLAGLVDPPDLPRLAAACVRVTLAGCGASSQR